MSSYLNLCTIYKSVKEEGMYLYVPKNKGLRDVPGPLINMFGKPKRVMDLVLKESRSLSRADIATVITELKCKGYYLQMPPPKENLLKDHLASQKERKEKEGDDTETNNTETNNTGNKQH